MTKTTSKIKIRTVVPVPAVVLGLMLVLSAFPAAGAGKAGPDTGISAPEPGKAGWIQTDQSAPPPQGTSTPATPAEKEVHLQRIDISGLPDIRIFFTVTDKTGVSVPGLTEKELEIRIDGIGQPATSLTSAFEGGAYLAVALLFDRSGSMKNALDKTREAGRAFLRRLSAGDEAAVIPFDHNVIVASGLTKDRAASEGAVDGIVLGGDTALYDAVMKALGILQAAQTPRQAVVVLSDGRDTKSKLDRETVLEAARTQGVPVFAINLDAAGDANNLRDFSSRTGGGYYEAAAPGDLLSLYQIIADQLNNQYVLTFHSSFGEDETFHVLEVNLLDPSGGVAGVKREYIASRGLGVTRGTVAGLESRVERQNLLLNCLFGAGAGLLLGLLILVLLRLVRPDIRMLSPLALALLLSVVGLGAVLGAIIFYTI